MKQLEIKTNKRLLIVEYDTEAECAIEWALMHAFNNPNIVNHGHKVKPICGGSELTEEILRSLIKNEISEFLVSWNWDYVSKEPLNDDFFPPMQSFISSIEASGYHWGENPVKFKENEMNWEKRHKNRIEWERAESRTFNPSKCIIFEIL
ncbi:hypothetical protein [Chryseobacterium sp. 2VB]|uniref:hypothetical protein n=1 Tax=Chryseobacterium sp. 2VB TaxID=2502204 RepID=UPI0010F96F24|nr:hypothetical protein [Chryseobacterium sp. 2VB]